MKGRAHGHHSLNGRGRPVCAGAPGPLVPPDNNRTAAGEAAVLYPSMKYALFS